MLGKCTEVVGSCWKLSRMLIKMGKSEKMIKIDPETPEIEENSPEIAKITKISKSRSDSKIAKSGRF